MAKCIQTYTTNIKKIICNQQERVVENYNLYWVWTMGVKIQMRHFSNLGVFHNAVDLQRMQ